jgi:hypothetical protein
MLVFNVIIEERWHGYRIIIEQACDILRTPLNPVESNDDWRFIMCIYNGRLTTGDFFMCSYNLIGFLQRTYESRD